MGLNVEQQKVVDSNSDRLLCLAGAGAGKALKNGTKVKTPTGDVAIEQLKLGDAVFASDGNAYPVTGIYPQGKKSVVRITFSDRNYIDCNEDHLWLYQTKSMRDRHRGFDVKTTKELTQIPLRKKSGDGFANNLYIPMCNPCNYPHQKVPIDSYFLGLLIGDGGLSQNHVVFHNEEPDLLTYVDNMAKMYDCHLAKYAPLTYYISKNSRDPHISNVLLNLIRELNLNCLSINKHIPDIYKYNDVETRLSVLQGIIDTDGHVSKSAYEISTASATLAMDIVEISESLGLTCILTDRDSHYVKNGQRIDLDHKNYRIFIKPSKMFPKLHRSIKHDHQRLSGGNQNYARRYITSIEYLGIDAEMTCISVDSPDHSFLTEHYIVTHNTKILIERISRLVNDGISPSNILALTFTNVAATEMRNRFEKKNPGIVSPEFKTFHAFCYSLMCKDPAIRCALGYTSIPNIASEAQEKSIDERAKTQCKITISKEKLQSRTGLSKQEQYQATLYDKAVTRLFLMENLITFDALNSKMSELFASDHPATKKYKEQYTYICSDEYQDTDYYQMKFLNSFTNSSFFFVGDTLQNLYSWRGTSNEYIKALSNSYGWEVIKLFTNYRSTNQICEYANKFSAGYADDSYRVEMKGTRDGDKVHTRLVDGPVGYSAINPKSLDNVVQEYSKLSGTTAILCRTNKEVSAIISYMKQHNIEFTTNHESKIQHLINCALSKSYMLNYLTLYLSSDKYGEYIRLSAQTEVTDLDWFLKLYGNVPAIKEDVALINKLIEIATTFGNTESRLAAVNRVFKLKLQPDDKTDYFGKEFLEYLLSITSNISESELYIGTIHSVKGLEYDNVFVMNVGSYSFKLNSEEMKNLFYVAITRAKNRLYIYELWA